MASCPSPTSWVTAWRSLSSRSTSPASPSSRSPGWSCSSTPGSLIPATPATAPSPHYPSPPLWYPTPLTTSASISTSKSSPLPPALLHYLGPYLSQLWLDWAITENKEKIRGVRRSQFVDSDIFLKTIRHRILRLSLNHFFYNKGPPIRSWRCQ